MPQQFFPKRSSLRAETAPHINLHSRVNFESPLGHRVAISGGHHAGHMQNHGARGPDIRKALAQQKTTSLAGISPFGRPADDLQMRFREPDHRRGQFMDAPALWTPVRRSGHYEDRGSKDDRRQEKLCAKAPDRPEPAPA